MLPAAAAGAAVGEAMLGARLGNRALWWGAGLALAPGLLDGLTGLVLRTAPQLAFAGGATHTLAAAGTAALFLPRWLGPLWKRDKVPPGRIPWFVALAWLCGVLPAMLTLPGVQGLWPFPAPRVCLHLCAGGDFLPALPLAGAVVAVALVRGRKKADLARRRRRLRWGVGLSAGCFSLLLAAKLWAGAGFAADLARRGAADAPLCTAPTAWNPLLWRGLARRDDALWLARRSLWEGPSAPVRWTILPRHSAAFESHAGHSEVRRLAAASGGWWVCRPNATGLWLADLRGGARLSWGARPGMVDLRCHRAWHFQPDVSGDPVRRLRLEPAQDPGEGLRRLARRSFGDRGALEGGPRLAGVPGSLPEILATSE